MICVNLVFSQASLTFKRASCNFSISQLLLSILCNSGNLTYIFQVHDIQCDNKKKEQVIEANEGHFESEGGQSEHLQNRQDKLERVIQGFHAF